jgi:hypothetical protein
MELYDNQGSSTPLTAKTIKANPKGVKQKKINRPSSLEGGFLFALYGHRPWLLLF